MTTPYNPHTMQPYGFSFHPHTMDVQTGRLWDSAEWEAGQSIPQRIQLFSSPAGKSLIDTNVSSPRRLDAPEQFRIDRLIFTFSKRCDERDVTQFIELMTFRLWLGQKHYLWSPLLHMSSVKSPLSPIKICDFCKSVYANSFVCPSCGANHFTLSSLGDIDTGQQYAIDVAPSIFIEQQQSFFVELEWSYKEQLLVLLGWFKFWCHFEGLHARGVQ